MNIEQLTKKFYEGDTTSDEERLLTDYFLNEENMDERWKDDRQVFLLLHDTQIQVPAGVSGRLEEFFKQIEDSPEDLPAIPLIVSTESPLKTLSVTTSKHSPETFPKPLPRKRTLYYWISSAAAVALLCIGLFFATREPSPPAMADTFGDPEEAALFAGQTLALISSQLNKGLEMAADVEKEFEKVNQLLDKHLSK